MKKIVISLIIVLSLNIFGLGALNKNIAQDNEFTKEEQYLIDNGHVVLAEDIRSLRLEDGGLSDGMTYENLIKFANDLVLSEVKALFYEQEEENSFAVVTTNTLGYIPIEGFTEAATNAISKVTGSIREDYAPGNNNNLDIYVVYKPVTMDPTYIEKMVANEPRIFVRYIKRFGLLWGVEQHELADKVLDRAAELYYEGLRNEAGWNRHGIDEDRIWNGDIPGTNNYNYIELWHSNMYSVYYPMEKSEDSESMDILKYGLDSTVTEVPLGIMYHKRLGWTFVVLELTNRDAINNLMKTGWEE